MQNNFKAAIKREQSDARIDSAKRQQARPKVKYINLSWAVVGFYEVPHQSLLSHIPGIDKDEAAAVEHYVIGYMAFWHIAFVDEDRLVSCYDDALRTEARQKLNRYIAGHLPIEDFPRFYLILLRQPIAPMEDNDMSRVYQM